MSELGDRLEALRAALAAQFPLRVVKRKAVDPANQPRADMVKGIYTIITQGEEGFTNVSGYEAEDARQQILILADFVIDAAGGNEADGEAIENAEFVMRDEVKAFCKNLPATLCALHLRAWAQSQQTVAPFGWAIFQLEYIP